MRRLQLLEEAGVFKSLGANVESDEAVHWEDASKRATDFRVSQKRPGELPKLEDTLSILYLSLVHIRLPTTVADVRNFVLEQGFPYLRPENAIPLNMMAKLPLAYRQTLYAAVSLFQSYHWPAVLLQAYEAYAWIGRSCKLTCSEWST